MALDLYRAVGMVLLPEPREMVARMVEYEQRRCHFRALAGDSDGGDFCNIFARTGR